MTSALEASAESRCARVNPVERAHESIGPRWELLASCGAIISLASGIFSRMRSQAGNRCASSGGHVDPATSVGRDDRSDSTRDDGARLALAQTWSYRVSPVTLIRSARTPC